MSAYRVEIYDGSQHPAPRPYAVERADTERDARRIAARLLGHCALRGASSWERYQGGTVYQFGPRSEDNEYDYAVVLSEDAEADEQRELARADYDCQA